LIKVARGTTPRIRFGKAARAELEVDSVCSRRIYSPFFTWILIFIDENFSVDEKFKDINLKQEVLK
jgi:hypothetical protein